MPGIQDYTDLVSTVQEITGHGDIASRAGRFTAMVESHINKTLRTGDMEKTAVLALSASGTVALPADYAQDRYLSKGVLFIDSIPYLKVQHNWHGYAIKGTTLYVYPDASVNVDLDYYAKIPSLETNSTNWLLTDTPELYEAGLLYQAYRYSKEFEAAEYHRAEMNRLIEDMNESDKSKRFSKTSIRRKASPA